MLISVCLTIIILTSFAFYYILVQTAYAQPSVRDTTLNVEPAVEGLSLPTSMAFLDGNNILVLEKEGNVRLISNGVLQEEPLLQIPVDKTGERGLLGIAIVNNSGGAGVDNVVADVFLYFTEADPLRNRVYKYQWNGQSLINPTLILDLPALLGPIHNAGKIVIGPDGYLYVIIGDLNPIDFGQLQNNPKGPPPNDTGVILRVNPEDGSAAPGNPFANSGNNLLSKYYAYGIRNSFGMDIDPLTGNPWITENGVDSYDEINLVRPGFNSGWQKVMGPISRSGHTEDELVNLPGSNYSDPLFSWRDPVSPTDIEFLRSSNLGEKYTNNIFVGDVNRGNLYFFEVNQNRDGINFNSSQESGLSDLVADSSVIKGTASIDEEELSAVTFGSGFGVITDIETGPDGLLYILSHFNGIIYKISPGIDLGETANTVQMHREPTRLKTDEPFAVMFSIAGVNNDTGEAISWVTANNVTRANMYNASDLDLVQTSTPAGDGIIEANVQLPNGTMHIGDKYKACITVPRHMYRVCDIGFNWPTNRLESFSVTIPILNGTENPVQTQRTQVLDEAPVVVFFSIGGVSNDTGEAISWVTANNVTNTLYYNATDTDLKDNRQDGFTELSVVLPNGTMHLGDEYKACTMVLKDDNLICNEGFNWPTDRYEYNSVMLP
jgi:glucose/arabinose dehydrogenase